MDRLVAAAVGCSSLTRPSLVAKDGAHHIVPNAGDRFGWRIYVKSRQPFERHFEITAGKLLGDDGAGTRFAFAKSWERTRIPDHDFVGWRRGVADRATGGSSRVGAHPGLVPIGMRFEHLLDASKTIHHEAWLRFWPCVPPP